jgi:hypothetical protein
MHHDVTARDGLSARVEGPKIEIARPRREHPVCGDAATGELTLYPLTEEAISAGQQNPLLPKIEGAHAAAPLVTT